MSDFIFKEGDIVTCVFYGDREFKLQKQDESDRLFIYIDESLVYYSFYEDGRVLESHTHPALKLVDRPRKKVKKWVVVSRESMYNEKINYEVFNSKEESEGYCSLFNITSDYYLGTFEIEVEEDEF